MAEGLARKGRESGALRAKKERLPQAAKN